MEIFLVVPANGSSIVECASSATPPTSLPMVTDVCGSALMASTPVLNSMITKLNSTPVSLSPTAAPGVWYTDRYNPAGFATGLFGGDSVLIHSINAADGSNLRPGSFSGAFYNTQGRGFDYGTATTYAEYKFIFHQIGQPQTSVWLVYGV